ncbi:hypothetical protein Ocin01_12495 [Orchesella cincta]|uniref:Uncharacterized protein n=1 Tax=Orchesella cincta TaxID=48709 RepID=A0A1D2MME3_ORCCI|nr:hypothetical protein Ocin01_12495 [Orchesella cincta]
MEIRTLCLCSSTLAIELITGEKCLYFYFQSFINMITLSLSLLPYLSHTYILFLYFVSTRFSLRLFRHELLRGKELSRSFLDQDQVCSVKNIRKNCLSLSVPFIFKKTKQKKISLSINIKLLSSSNQ